MKPKCWSHPKFEMLQRRLRISKALAAGILEGVWHLAATFDEHGGQLACTGDELAAWMGYEGNGDELLESLIACRWLDRSECGVAVHDWLDHRPGYLNDRDRQRRHRGSVSRDGHVTVCDNTELSRDRNAPSASASACINKKDPPTESLSSSCTPRRRVTTYQPVDMEVARWLLRQIRATVVPDLQQPNLEAWANDVRLMRERDGRSQEDIQAVFSWANQDDFWRPNVLCPSTLRKRFDQLKAKMVCGHTHAGNGQQLSENEKAIRRLEEMGKIGKDDE